MARASYPLTAVSKRSLAVVSPLARDARRRSSAPRVTPVQRTVNDLPSVTAPPEKGAIRTLRNTDATQ